MMLYMVEKANVVAHQRERKKQLSISLCYQLCFKKVSKELVFSELKLYNLPEALHFSYIIFSTDTLAILFF